MFATPGLDPGGATREAGANATLTPSTDQAVRTWMAVAFPSRSAKTRAPGQSRESERPWRRRPLR
jgi:hypothetical protein